MTDHSVDTTTTTDLDITQASVLYEGALSEPRLAHPEGVAVDSLGNVWCGTETGQLMRITPEGETEVMADTGGFLLGLCISSRGQVFVCDLKHRCVFVFDMRSRELTRLDCGDIRIPNYPALDEKRGWLYVSDSYESGKPGPGIWRLELNSLQSELWWDQPMAFANGLALSPAGDKLYVAETFARKVSCIDIDADGRPSGITDVVSDVPGLPDGIAFDDRGQLFIACYEPSRICRVDTQGRLSRYIEDPTAHMLCHPTNIAFAGNTLYSANLGRWHITRIETDTHGTILANRPQPEITT